MTDTDSFLQSNAQAFDVKAFLTTLTLRPGVYRMLDEKGQVLYVGKAKKLKNRVSSYFRSNHPSIKTRSLVSKIADIEVTVTNSETEALLLEQTLIKELKPPYNILLRDDKSYPYIYLSQEQDFPRLAFHRGAKRGKGKYFGPYPSAGAVRESLGLLQKVFKVRQCEDSFYRNRSRPCLQYQIKRCSGPCVNKVDKATYDEDVRHTRMFLEGRSQEVISELVQTMETASEQLDFEKAAEIRDQIVALRRIQETQFVEGEGGDVDVISVATQSGGVCVQALFVRKGRVLGSKSYFPKAQGETDAGEILEEFLPQFYLNTARSMDIPKDIILDAQFESEQALEEILTEKTSRKTRIEHNVRGNRAGWLRLAQTNAEQNLTSYLANRQNLFQRYQALQDALELEDLPRRLECFDISHTQGEGTVASCVVFDQNGPKKSDYRRFNIEGITAGDDYAAMQQALDRRYTRLKRGEGKLPDILLIDGGKGQIAQASAVLEELQITDVLVVGVAKGPSRKAGLETLHIPGEPNPIQLSADSPALHLVQHIRDEAHRFAITGHRQRRDKKRRQSPLEGIPGVGPKRRRQLLNHFGGMQEILRASAGDLANVPGISKKMAEDIYAALHNV